MKLGWIVAGAAGLLLTYEAWRRWQATSPATASSSQSLNRKSLEDPPMFLGASGAMTLRTGQKYRMRFRASTLDWTLLPGFSGAIVYTTASSLPSDWPAIARGQDDTETRFAVGTWTAPSTTLQKPDGLWQIWPTESKLT